MRVIIRNWSGIQVAAGFLGGFLTFHLLHVSLQGTSTQQDISTSRSDVNAEEMVPIVKIPSLDEDWGELECSSTKLSDDHQNLYDYITKVTLPCEKQVMVGGKFFGGRRNKAAFFDDDKYICIDESFAIINGDCICLDFGISRDWAFDDELDKVFGCKVYAFDPTVGLQDHERSENIKFFNMGLSDGPGKLGGGTLESYSEILKMLKLEDTNIDYLKIDVEGSEWKFFEDVLTRTPNLLKKVKQIGMEIHLKRANLANVWSYFQHLECFGFRIIFIHYNAGEEKKYVNGQRRANHYEIVWGQDRKW